MIKKFFVYVMLALIFISNFANPIILLSAKAEGITDSEGFDESKVSISFFEVINVDGGVAITLTSVARNQTEPIHVPTQINGKNVVAVANDGFRNSQASAIYFEDSSLITNIGTNAFRTTKATNVINLPNIISVPDNAFYESKFSQIILDGNKITSIGTWAFYYSDATNVMNLPNITTVPDNAFRYSSFSAINLDGNKITSIGINAFTYSKATNVMNLPNITTVPDNAFFYSNFSQINLDGNKITSIGAYAFEYSNATNVMNLPKITTVPTYAFSYSNFSQIVLDGNKITSIGTYAFRSAKATNVINLPNITSVPDSAFRDSSFSAINLDGNKITSIGTFAFLSAKATNVIDLPNITSVPVYAFTNSNFSQINLDGNKITSIGTVAFDSSKATNVINLPNITSVPEYAFYDSNFSQIVLNADKITSVEADAFTSTPDFTAEVEGNKITVHPNSQVNVWEIKYTEGTQTADYFKTNGTVVTDNQFTVSSNGTYTIYLRDGANREVVKTVDVTSIEEKIETVNIEIKKVWEDGTDSADVPKNVQVKLFADGKEVATYTLNDDNDWTINEIFNKYNEDGDEIEYMVEELTEVYYDPDNFLFSQKKQVIENDNDETTIQFTLTAKENPWMDFKIEVQWDEGSTPRIGQVHARILADGEELKTRTLTKDDDWETNISVRKYNQKGETVQYEIQAEELKGYTSRIEKSCVLPTDFTVHGFFGTSKPINIEVDNQECREDEGKIVQYNIIYTEKEPIPPIISMNVDGLDYKEVNLDEEFNLNISTKFPDNLEGYQYSGILYEFPENILSLEETVYIDGKEIQDIPVYIQPQDNGGDILYVELLPDDLELYGLQDKTLTIQIKGVVYPHEPFKTIETQATFYLNVRGKYEQVINSNHVQIKTKIPSIDISVEKQWEGEKQKEVTINVLNDNDEIVASTTLSDDNNWKYIFTNLPQLDNEGKEINYSVQEVTVDGYTTEITGNNQDGYIIKNKMNTPTTPNIEIDVNGQSLLKTDYETDFHYNIHTIVPNLLVGFEKLVLTDNLPSDITITGTKVFVDGEETSFKATVEGQKITLELSREQLETIKGKPLNLQVQANVKKGVRTDEIQNKAFIQLNEYEQQESNIVLVQPNIPFIDIPVEVQWNKEQQDKTTIELYANGNKIDEVTVSTTNDWKHTFEHYYQFDEEGNPIEYTIKQQTFEGYTTEVQGSVQEGFVMIYNVIPPTTPNISLTVNNQEHLDVHYDENFVYSANFTIPNLLVGITQLKVTDVLPNNVAIGQVKVVVDNEEQNINPTIDKQTMTVTLDRATLETLKGKTVQVQIQAKVKNNTPIESIYNEAQLQLNDGTPITSNVVTVLPTEENSSTPSNPNETDDKDDSNNNPDDNSENIEDKDDKMKDDQQEDTVKDDTDQEDVIEQDEDDSSIIVEDNDDEIVEDQQEDTDDSTQDITTSEEETTTSSTLPQLNAKEVYWTYFAGCIFIALSVGLYLISNRTKEQE